MFRCYCFFAIFCLFSCRVDENHSIRVADFGLAKDVYISEYYRADKHTLLPIKWMALESILDQYFNEKTDVVCPFALIFILYLERLDAELNLMH